MTGGIVWLTGIPAAGKSTIAKALQKNLLARGTRAEILDGDEIRKHLSPDLDFTREGRERQAARVAHVALMLARNGVWALVALVSPYASSRARAREDAAAQGSPFVEVHVKCSLESARRRDPKGLYKKAAAGDLADLTGTSAPYEEPAFPEVVVETDTTPLAACVDLIMTKG
ncbi:MAG TPA: adenylyl-sulfate kinase, partial [Planctomycetota bacterium]|nr:adenylyl-sulfate kinase [Planctomycetota bacterium]